MSYVAGESYVYVVVEFRTLEVGRIAYQPRRHWEEPGIVKKDQRDWPWLSPWRSWRPTRLLDLSVELRRLRRRSFLHLWWCKYLQGLGHREFPWKGALLCSQPFDTRTDHLDCPLRSLLHNETPPKNSLQEGSVQAPTLANTYQHTQNSWLSKWNLYICNTCVCVVILLINKLRVTKEFYFVNFTWKQWWKGEEERERKQPKTTRSIVCM